MEFFGEIRQRVLKMDYEMRQLGCNLDGTICRNMHHTRPKSHNVERRQKFQSHPKRLTSDSDSTQSMVLSKLHGNLSSSTSNLNFEREHYIQEERKKRAQNLRKKLHEKLSQINPVYTEDTSYLIRSLGHGDSCEHSPKYFDMNVREIYNRDKPQVLEEFKATEDEKLKKKNVIKPEHCKGFAQRTMSNAIFERKFKTIVEKSCHTINNIRDLMEKGSIEADGAEDISRRELRVKEFCNRFSRNYLYPLARQIADINDPIKNLKGSILNQKLLSTYQTILNGLQAYQHHLPSSTGTCACDRFKILLLNILQVCDIQTKSCEVPEDKDVADFLSSFKLNVEITLQKIEDNLTAPVSTDSILKSNNTRISLPKYTEPARGDKKSNKKSGFKKNALEKRLSMYSVTASFRKEAPWKKAVQTLAQTKFSVKSKYKTATFKHRPPLQKEELLNVPKLKGIKKSDLIKQTPMTSPIREENIKTMVQFIENNEEKLKEKNENFQNSDVIAKFLKLIEENKSKAESTQNLMPILEFLQNEKNFEVFRTFVEEMNNKNDNNDINTLTLQIVNSQSSIPPETGVKKRKEPKVVKVEGEKNARLICIEDDNSIIVSDEETKTAPKEVAESKECQTGTEKPPEIKKTSSETQTDINSNEEKPSKATQKSLNKIKIARATKSGRKLKMLRKNLAVPVIQYKLDFYRHSKNNPMYKKAVDVQPWVLMGQISEKLLNESLLEVAKEIEVNEVAVINEVFESQLQL